MGPAHGLADDAQQEQPQHAAAEDRRQFPPSVQHAVDAHHQQSHDDAQCPHDERRGVEHPHALLFGELLFREPLGEVRQHDRRRGVDARGDGGHAGREERGYHESGESRGESVDDEPREYLVRGRAGGQQFGTRRVVGEERRADVDEDQRHGDVEQSAEKGRFHGFGRRAGRHVALHVVLVDAVVLHVDEQSVDEHHPEGRFRKARAETAEAELAVGRGDFEELPGQYDEDDALDGVGPDHGGDAAQQGVDQRGDARADDDGLDVPAEHRVQRQGQQQQDRAHAGELRQQVADRHVTAGPVAEAHFEVVVGRDAVDSAVERDEDLGREPRGDGDREAEYEGVPVAFVGVAGESEEADAADERGEDRHAHDPGGQRPFGGGECRGALAAAEVERAAEEGDAAHEDEEDEVIE